jgi:hypothetical protein
MEANANDTYEKKYGEWEKNEIGTKHSRGMKIM